MSAKSLEELDLSNCDLDSHKVKSMLDITPHALRVLKLNMSMVGDHGAQAVAQFILKSGGRTLVKLQMGSNNIKEAGALALAGAFAKAYALRCIDMHGNLFGPRGATAILDALATASIVPMDKIDFEACQIEDAGAEAAGRLIARRGCRHALFVYNDIYVAGVKRLRILSLPPRAEYKFWTYREISSTMREWRTSWTRYLLCINSSSSSSSSKSKIEECASSLYV